jgi:hypothetical protein
MRAVLFATAPSPFAHARRSLRQVMRRPRELPVCRYRIGTALLAVGLGFALAAAGRAQEAVRLSLAGAEAAEARRKAASTLGYYNLKLGSTAWNFNAGLGLEANDNIQLESVNPKSDLIFRPEIDARMVWPLTEQNSLNLALGAGYSAYVRYPQYSRFYVTPGSEVSFDLYIGDFWLNFHDRASILEDSYQDPTVVGTANFTRLENALGVAATWDLNRIVTRAGYDHVTYLTLQGSQASGAPPDGDSEVFSASTGYRVRSGIVVGVEAGTSLIHYSSVSLNQTFTDATQWNAGGFCEAQLSKHMAARGSVGYTEFLPEPFGTNQNLKNLSGVYAQLSLTHRLNRFLDYSISGGRTLSSTFYGGTVVLLDARVALNWNILRNITLSTAFAYEHGTQAYSTSEVFDRYGPSVALARRITSRLSASLGYQYYWRGSDLPNRDYSNNLLRLDVSYRF